jgi:hypothetical protein
MKKRKSEVVGTCLVPGCGRPVTTPSHARGMCGRCQVEARRMIQAGQTSWRELEDLGLARPPLRKIFKKPTPLTQAMTRKRAEARGPEGLARLAEAAGYPVPSAQEDSSDDEDAARAELQADAGGAAGEGV